MAMSSYAGISNLYINKKDQVKEILKKRPKGYKHLSQCYENGIPSVKTIKIEQEGVQGSLEIHWDGPKDIEKAAELAKKGVKANDPLATVQLASSYSMLISQKKDKTAQQYEKILIKALEGLYKTSFSKNQPLISRKTFLALLFSLNKSVTPKEKKLTLQYWAQKLGYVEKETLKAQKIQLIGQENDYKRLVLEATSDFSDVISNELPLYMFEISEESEIKEEKIKVPDFTKRPPVWVEKIIKTPQPSEKDKLLTNPMALFVFLKSKYCRQI